MRLLQLLESKVTDNPNFMRWFGDSKVVDSNGDPLIVYHGTNQDFNAFSGMVWGSVGKDLPYDYASMRAEFNGGGALMMPLYLRIEKPFNADMMPKTVTVGDVFNAMLEQAGYTSELPEPMRVELQYLWDTVEKGRREEESGPHYSRQDFWNDARATFGRSGAFAIRLAFKLLEFDGIQMMEGGELTFGAFDPSQAKSVYNVGTYDRDSANISEDE